MQRILLFGGGGFIGQHLSALLAAKSGTEVTVVDRDTALTPERLAAHVVVVMTQPGGPVRDILLPALARREKPVRIVYLSSLLVYPNSALPQDETRAPFPLTAYEKGKYEEEGLFSDVARAQGHALTILRLGNVYGDTQNRGVVNALFLSALFGKTFAGCGDLSKMTRDYLYIDDAVTFLQYAIATAPPLSPSTFNICTGEGHTLAALIEEVGAITGVPMTMVMNPPKREKQSVVGSPTKFFSWSGLRARFSLRQGLRKTYERYQGFYKSL